MSFKNNNDDVLVYDLECEVVGEKPDGSKDKLKVCGFYSYKNNKNGIIPYSDKDAIKKLFDTHKFLVGFNNKEYDNPILERFGVDLKYKRVIDLYVVFKTRAGGMVTKKGMLGDNLMKYSLDYITRFLELVDDNTAKDEIDYDIFKKNSWTHDEVKKIKEYTLRDIEITRKLYEWVEQYFENFKEYLPQKDVDNKYYLTDSVANFAYKAICHAMGWEPVYNKNVGDISDEDKISGGYVAYPAGERFEGNLYQLDFASLYPSIMIQCNLYGRNKNAEGWHGGGVWNVNGYYDNTKLSGVSELLRKWYFLRIHYKRKGILENGVEFKYKDASKHIGEKYYVVRQNDNGLVIEFEELTESKSKELEQLASEGKDVREYTVKTIINTCFSGDTEILTENGVKNIKKCEVGENVYTINKKNKQLEKKPIIDMQKIEYDGEMLHFKNQTTDLKVTPDHDMIIENENDEIKTKKAHDVYNKKIMFPKHRSDFLSSANFMNSEYEVETKKERDEYMKQFVERAFIPYYYMKNERFIISRNENSDNNIPNNNTKIQNDDDFVYCVTVEDNHTVLAGRNGKFQWVGQCYGILNTPYYQLVHDKIAGGDCTLIGRQWTKYARKVFRDEGYKLIYTDSVSKDATVRLMNGDSVTVEDYWNKYSYDKEYDDKETAKCLEPILTCDDNFKNVLKIPKKIIRHKTKKKMYRIFINDNEYIDVTEDHSLITINPDTQKYNVVKPKDLIISKTVILLNKKHMKDSVYDDEKGFVNIVPVKIEGYYTDGYVYDFSIDGYEKFYANDVLVHNTDSWYFEDVFNDRERVMRTKDKVINDIKKSVPFPQPTFDADIDSEMKYMFFFKSDKKNKSDEEDVEMDEDDFKNKPKGLMKKNYIYVNTDDTVTIKNLGIKRKNISPLSKKIFWDYLVPRIVSEGVVKFNRTEIENLMVKLLKEDLSLAMLRKSVSSLSYYKNSMTGIHAQISKRYGSGIHFMIPNNKGIGVGKRVTYCSEQEFKEYGMGISDIDFSIFWSELGYFIKEPKKVTLFDF